MTAQAPQPLAFYLDQNMTAPAAHDLPGGQAVVFSARSPDKNSPNEDGAAIYLFGENDVVLAIADGLGGQKSGHHASHLALKALHEGLAQAAAEGETPRTAILNGIEKAGEAVLALGVGAATTLVVIEIQEGCVRPYHVGDSVILVTGQRGRIKLQTVAHSPVGFAVEAGLLNEEEAMHHEERHIVLNVVGASNMRIEVGTAFQLDPFDTVLLASDGLSDNLSIEEISSRVRTGDLTQAVRQLVADASGRMTNAVEGRPSKPDDLTVIAYRRRR